MDFSLYQLQNFRCDTVFLCADWNAWLKRVFINKSRELANICKQQLTADFWLIQRCLGRWTLPWEFHNMPSCVTFSRYLEINILVWVSSNENMLAEAEYKVRPNVGRHKSVRFLYTRGLILASQFDNWQFFKPATIYSRLPERSATAYSRKTPYWFSLDGGGDFPWRVGRGGHHYRPKETRREAKSVLWWCRCQST